eukprot:TRINITY_DN2805_c0_g1_i6.p1 TRINITY_DN2805_c0_g1~~TRINITY_DN2805_c0_g1_i6.p1  ORF type:complete len:121 (+),score=13.76 TRINITY_DN2805_c0_g1_i6:16-378(+)
MLAKGQHVRGVLFDLDGLLMNTEPLYFKAYASVLEHLGHVYDEDLRLQVLGKAEVHGVQIILDTKGISCMTPHQFLEKRDEVLLKSFLQATPMPGALALTQHLKNHSIPIALATRYSGLE